MKIKARRLLSAVVLLGGALLTSGCGIHGLHMQQSPLLKYFVPKSGHIAFVGTAGNIEIVNQSGRVTHVTYDGQTGASAKISYSMPTWSFDGKHIVFARFEVNSATKTQKSTVFIANVSGKNLHAIFSSKRLAPFYFYWSPDGREIGMLSQILGSGGGIQMGVVPVSAKDPPPEYRVINANAPFYWVWTPNGKTIVAHTQTGDAQNAPDFVRIIPVNRWPLHYNQLKATLGAFDTPAITDGGKDAVIAIGTSDASDLVARNLANGKERLIAKALGSLSYTVSPNGKWLAFIDQADSKDSSARELHVVNLANPNVSFTVKEHPVFAFYWSPNSREIAYVIPVQSAGSIDSMFAQSKKLPYAQLQVVDVGKRDSWSVSQYPITGAFLNEIPFNDQYQHSSTIWSPNSKYLVFSAHSAKGDTGIYVVSADGNLKPDLVARGKFPTWSWR